MGIAERIGMGIIGVAMVTTVILPERKSAQVIDALRKLFTMSLGTAMGTVKPTA